MTPPPDDPDRARFLAELSHELRTPLNAVIGFADAMRERAFGPLGDQYAAHARHIHDAGRHMLTLIDAMTALADAQSEVRPAFETFDACAEIAGAAAMIGEALPPSPFGEGDSRSERGGVLPEPPQSPTPVADATRPPQEGREKETLAPPAIAVRADRLALRQIAINLIANARQAAGSDGVVTVALETDGADLILIVDDDGPGISPDADTPRQGLGLALVRRLCALHGGSLVLHSQAGVGVTAVARLPVIGQA